MGIGDLPCCGILSRSTITNEALNEFVSAQNAKIAALLQNYLLSFGCLAISLLLYAGIFAINVPRDIGLYARYGFISVFIAIALLIYPAYRLNGWLGKLLSLSLTLLLFGLPLKAAWSNGLTSWMLIGGLLPWADASIYYLDAQRLLAGYTLSTVSASRPLFPSFLATFLGLTAQNLPLTLALLVAITAFACFFAAREVQKTHGTVAGLLILTVLFFFYRRFSGTTLTENLGLTLGATAFAILWRGINQNQIYGIFLGGFLLTLALAARAGAFFVLPAFILWGTLAFRGKARISWTFLLGSTSAILLGLLLNSLLFKVTSSPNDRTFSNAAYTLYGQVVGGKNWTQVFRDYPELNALPEAESSQRAYSLALEVFRRKPLGLVQGVFRAWQNYFDPRGTPAGIGAFSFLGFASPIFHLFHLLGFGGWLIQRKDKINSFLGWLTLGIWLSVPFLPPIDDGEMRVYAATIPISAALATMGTVQLYNLITEQRKKQIYQLKSSSSSTILPSNGLFAFAIILGGLLFLGPLLLKLSYHPLTFPQQTCDSGNHSLFVHFNPSSALKITNDEQQTHLPTLRQSDLSKAMQPLLYRPDFQKLSKLISSNLTLLSLLNLSDGKAVWLLTPSNLLPKKSEFIQLCAKPMPDLIEDPFISERKYHFFVVESIQNSQNP